MGVAEVWNSRTLTLLGEEAVGRLARARVLVAGVGGVGGYAAEMLARSGVGHLTLVDADNVAVSNINRQIIATSDAVGESKVWLFADRFRAINPEIDVRPIQEYLDADNIPALLDREFDYVIDAIDTVAPKMTLILECLRRGIPIISSMGAGGRLDPSKVGYFDISETRDDGLARVVRQRLRKAGIRRGLTVVASTERPERHSVIPLDERNKRSSFGTIATIPALFGIFLSSKVIDEICWK
ncbi:MAG: tRNA threonylcarbamoyladenosine dehydratase [Bacteroidales bacterium]|nr:tRNA threonylcarbamoyladenosine dehydratase [Bacteroidales bacterium]